MKTHALCIDEKHLSVPKNDVKRFFKNPVNYFNVTTSALPVLYVSCNPSVHEINAFLESFFLFQLSKFFSHFPFLWLFFVLVCIFVVLLFSVVIEMPTSKDVVVFIRKLRSTSVVFMYIYYYFYYCELFGLNEWRTNNNCNED